MRDCRFVTRALCMVVVSTAALLLAGRSLADSGSGHGHAFSGPAIAVEYACGNSFAIINSAPEPIALTYRVAGTKEKGTVGVRAAPEEDPHFSEAVIETRNSGTLELFQAGNLVTSRANDQVPCVPQPPLSAPALAAADADTGAWSTPFPWPYVAIHLHLLPDGQVLSIGHSNPQVWNPATGAFEAKPSSDILYCSGHAFLADGRLFIAGGHIALQTGLTDLNTYSTGAGFVALTPAMRTGRWYPTVTTMAHGEVVILAGRVTPGNSALIPEVWNSGSLRALDNASLSLPMYPRAFLAPNGRLFYAGGGYDDVAGAQTSRYLNISGSGSWTTVGNKRTGDRSNGAAVMYLPGRILYAGGGRTTNTAEIINLNASRPRWTLTKPMAFARQNLNLTLLPTGEVLATSGTAGTGFNDLTKVVLAAEIWNPATGVWRTVASASVPRGYHSTAILLPDARVLVAGSGNGMDARGKAAPNQLSGELYSPPYLFNGARPTITSVPASVGYGADIRVTTPDASTITKVSLIRLGSATHAFNMNQRYQALNFTSDSSGLSVSIPTSRNVTPPGHYMLFILNGAGVPSVANIVRIG